MVTKERYFHKPTYDTLTSSLRVMRDTMSQNNMKKLSIPQIGKSGLTHVTSHVSGLTWLILFRVWTGWVELGEGERYHKRHLPGFICTYDSLFFRQERQNREEGRIRQRYYNEIPLEIWLKLHRRRGKFTENSEALQREEFELVKGWFIIDIKLERCIPIKKNCRVWHGKECRQCTSPDIFDRTARWSRRKVERSSQLMRKIGSGYMRTMLFKIN